MQGLTIIDKHDTDTDTKPSGFKTIIDDTVRRLFLFGIVAIIAKLLGFTEASWWLVLMPIYMPFVVTIGIILLSIPILMLLVWLDEKETKAVESKTDDPDGH